MRFSTATPMLEQQHRAPPSSTGHDGSTVHPHAAFWKQGSPCSSSRGFSTFAVAALSAARDNGSHTATASSLASGSHLTGSRAAGAASSFVQPRRRMCAGAEAQRAPAAYCINVYTGKSAASHLATTKRRVVPASALLKCTQAQ